MEKKEKNDLCSLLNPDGSLLRKICSTLVNLNDYDLPLINLDNYSHHLDFKIDEEKGALEHIDDLARICEHGKYTGKHEKFYGGVYEAFRNAHQHGNKNDANKSVTISYEISENYFEVVISDEGGSIIGDFIPFILLHRSGNLKNPFGFYDFAPQVKQDRSNSGIGTYVIHSVSDDVRYYKNSKGGLSVCMRINKD